MRLNLSGTATYSSEHSFADIWGIERRRTSRGTLGCYLPGRKQTQSPLHDVFLQMPIRLGVLSLFFQVREKCCLTAALIWRQSNTSEGKSPLKKREGELTLLDGDSGCGDVVAKKNDAPPQSQLFEMLNSICIFQHQDLSECLLSAGMPVGVQVCNRPCMDSFVYWSTGGHICISFACHFAMKKRLSSWSRQ